MTASFLIAFALQVMLPIGLLVAAGALWPRFYPGIPVTTLRAHLNNLVLYLFVPALLFAVAATANVDRGLMTVPLLVGGGILITGLLLYGLLYRTPMGRRLAPPTRAALMICGMFGNILFLGLPVNVFLYGPQGSQYPAFADIMAATPLVWTLGVWIATRLGRSGPDAPHSLGAILLRLPPVWAFALGALVNIAGWPVGPLVEAARFIGQPTVPIMMVVLGLTITWRDLRPTTAVMSVVAVKLVVMPAMVWVAALAFFSPLGEPQYAAIVEAGMPTMLMALLFADRFGLDTRAAALTVMWSTALFWVTLPLWLLIL